MKEEDVKGTVIITVAKAKGCLLHKVGQTWRLLPGNVDRGPRKTRRQMTTSICPEALVAINPTIYSMRWGATLPWFKKWEKGEYCKVRCPYSEKEVQFEVKRISK